MNIWQIFHGQPTMELAKRRSLTLPFLQIKSSGTVQKNLGPKHAIHRNGSNYREMADSHCKLLRCTMLVCLLQEDDLICRPSQYPLTTQEELRTLNLVQFEHTS
jgi:hypothetical protein